MTESNSNSWIARAASVASSVLAKHAADVDTAGRWPGESVAALAESGVLGLTVPSALGGGGQGPETFAAVTACLAEHCASTAMIFLMHVCGVQLMAASKTLERREEILRQAARGKHLTTLAFSEKGSRSHFWAPVSQAVRQGATDYLSADKSWVTSAGYADSYLVSTRTAGAAEPSALTLYFVDSKRPGVQVSGPWNGLGLRGNASAPLRLERVAVEPADRISADSEGFGLMMEAVLPWFQLGSAAVSVGIATAATESIRQHLLASRLEHLGQSLASLMNLRARLAQMQITTHTQRAFLREAALAMTQPGPQTLLTILESKAAAAEAALLVTDLAMRTGGGACFSRHLSAERNFRDARAASVMAPTTDVLHDFIGRSMLGMPLF